MKTAAWGNGEAYSLAHAEVRGVAAVCDPSGALFLPYLHMLVVSDLHLGKRLILCPARPAYSAL